MFGNSNSPPAVEAFSAHRWENGCVTPCSDLIASEVAVALVYNGTPHVVMMATPGDIEDFALGFTLSEGIVRRRDEFFGVRVRTVRDGIEADVRISTERFRDLDRKQRNLTGRIGCGLCGAQTLAQAVRHPLPVAKTTSLSPVVLHEGMAKLVKMQPLNIETGAVHAAGWISSEGEIALVREDVGRHNALDKLIGAMVDRDLDFSGGAALITSRASYEMIQKAATMGVEIVCAISAPTALAIRLAQETGVTLAAFTRGHRHTIYAHPERIEYRAEHAAV